MQTTNDGAATRFVRAAAATGGLVTRAAGHLLGLARDARTDALTVARESEALWILLVERGAALLGAVRATPRLARVLGEALRIITLARLRAGDDDGRATARRVRDLCIELRGGVLKLGQIASSRPDLLPRAAIEELSLLQDRVPPIADAAIRELVAAELGRPLEEVFARFGPAIAAASLAQVHEAELLDGTPVAVKVLVPGIEAIVEADLHALRVLAAAGADSLPGVDVATTVAELTRAVRSELDCRAEAAALLEFGRRFAGRAAVLAPRPHLDLCTTRVLVMERIDGARLADYLAAADPAGRERVVATLVDCFAEQILEHGVFHADPHPGNFLVVDGDGGPRVALLDFGCVRRLPDGAARAYARLVLAVLSADAPRAAALFGELGFATRDGDTGALQRLAEMVLAALGENVDLATLDPRRQLVQALAVLQENPVARVPEHFVLVGRVLATLAGLVFTHPPRGGLMPILAPRLARAAAQTSYARAPA